MAVNASEQSMSTDSAYPFEVQRARDILRAVLFAVLMFLFGLPVSAQEYRVSEAARKDGRVTVYGSLEDEQFTAIKNSFEKKTGMFVDYWRASNAKVLERAISEQRVRKPLFDVVLNNEDPMEIMFKEGVLTKYDSPAAKNFSKDAIHPDLGVRYRNVIIGIVYNSVIVKPADAPKSLEDLVKPQFRGKLVMPDPTQHSLTTQWLASLHKIMGKEKADKLIRDLAAARPALVESVSPAADRVVSGETPIAIAFVKFAFEYVKKGAPVDYVRLGKMLGDGHYVGIGFKAAHPDAAKAFVDFFLGDESMNIMASMGEFVNRKGIYPPLKDAEKIEFVSMDHLGTKGFAEKKEEYKKLFLQ
jgi:iron(III) transport system substrate-binding protein